MSILNTPREECGAFVFEQAIFISSSRNCMSRESSVSCGLCGAPARLLFERFGSGIYSCPKCVFQFLHPQPDDAALRTVYSENYFIGGERDEDAEHAAALKR